MTDYVKSTLRDIILEYVVLHAGTNNLRTENTASQIAKATIDLATSWKNDYKTVNVSGIVPRYYWLFLIFRNQGAFKKKDEL